MKRRIRNLFNNVLIIIKKIPILRSMVSYLLSKFGFSKKKLNDSLMGYEAYVFDSSYINERDFQEPHIIKLFKDNIEDGEVVFDVGAHFGYFTLLSRKLVGNKGKVISFEPSPIPLDFLKRNIILNKFNNVYAESLMISDIQNRYNFYYSGFGGTMSSFQQRKDLVFKKVVNSTTLDKYISENNIVPNFVKIDVEGADLLAITGFRESLKIYNIKVLLELHYKQLSKEDITSLIEIFEGLNYGIFSIFRDGENYKLSEFTIKNLPNHILLVKKV